MQCLIPGPALENLCNFLKPAHFWRLRELSQSLHPLIIFGEKLSAPIYWPPNALTLGLCVLVDSLALCHKVDIRFNGWTLPSTLCETAKTLNTPTCKCLLLSLFLPRNGARALISNILEASVSKKELTLRINHLNNGSVAETISFVLQSKAAPENLILTFINAPLASRDFRETSQVSSLSFHRFEVTIMGDCDGREHCGSLEQVLGSITAKTFVLDLDGCWRSSCVGGITFPLGLECLVVRMTSLSSAYAWADALLLSLKKYKSSSLMALAISAHEEYQGFSEELVKVALAFQPRDLLLNLRCRGSCLQGAETYGFLNLTTHIITQVDVNAIVNFCSKVSRLTLHVQLHGRGLTNLRLPNVNKLELIIETFSPGGTRQDLGALLSLAPRSIENLSIVFISNDGLCSGLNRGLPQLLKILQLAARSKYTLHIYNVNFPDTEEIFREAFSHPSPPDRKVYMELQSGRRLPRCEAAFLAAPLFKA